MAVGWLTVLLSLLLCCSWADAANRDPQLLYANFESNAGQVSFVAASQRSPFTGWCGTPALFGSFAALLNATGGTINVGVLDANGAVDLSLYSSSCLSAATMNVSYFNGSAMISGGVVTSPVSPAAQFSSVRLASINVPAPGTVVQLGPVSTHTAIDELAVDCVNVPCPAAAPVTIASLDYDVNTDSENTGGQLILSNTTLASCIVTGSRSLLMRGAGTQRQKTISALNVAAGGRVSFDLWISNATNASCIVTNEVGINTTFVNNTFSTVDNCTQGLHISRTAPWINEVVTRGKFTLNSAVWNDETNYWIPIGGSNDKAIYFNTTKFPDFRGGVEIAGPVGLSLDGYALAIAHAVVTTGGTRCNQNQATKAYTIVDVYNLWGQTLQPDPDPNSDFDLGFFSVWTDWYGDRACINSAFATEVLQGANGYVETSGCVLMLLYGLTGVGYNMPTVTPTIEHALFWGNPNCGFQTITFQWTKVPSGPEDLFIPATAPFGLPANLNKDSPVFQYVPLSGFDGSPTSGAASDAQRLDQFSDLVGQYSICLLSLPIRTGLDNSLAGGSSTSTDDYDPSWSVGYSSNFDSQRTANGPFSSFNITSVVNQPAGSNGTILRTPATDVRYDYSPTPPGYYWYNRCAPTLYSRPIDWWALDTSAFPRSNPTVTRSYGANWYALTGGAHNFAAHSAQCKTFNAWDGSNFVPATYERNNASTPFCPAERNFLSATTYELPGELVQRRNCSRLLSYNYTLIVPTNVSTPGCCGQPTTVELQYSPSSGVWTTIAAFSTTGATFTRQTVFLPSRTRGSVAGLRWLQRLPALTPEGFATWGLDSISVTNNVPSAGAAGFALQLAAGSTSTMVFDAAPARPLTIEFFVRAQGAWTAGQPVLTCGTLVSVQSTGTAGQISVGGATVNAATWQLVQLVYTTTAVSVYVGGVAAGGQANAGAAGTSIVATGVGGAVVEIDELRVWSAALTVSELQRYLTRPAPVTAASLFAYWSFDEGACGRAGNALSYSDQSVLSTSVCWSQSGANLLPTVDVQRGVQTLISFDNTVADAELSLTQLATRGFEVTPAGSATTVGRFYFPDALVPGQLGAQLAAATNLTLAQFQAGLYFVPSPSAAAGTSAMLTYRYLSDGWSTVSGTMYMNVPAPTPPLSEPPRADDVYLVFYTNADLVIPLSVSGQPPLTVQLPQAPTAGALFNVASYPASLTAGVSSVTYIFPASYASLMSASFPYAVTQTVPSPLSSPNASVVLTRGALIAYNDAYDVPNAQGLDVVVYPLANDYVYVDDAASTVIVLISAPAVGTAAVGADGVTVVYTPPANFALPSQLVSMTYTIDNPRSPPATATIVFNVTWSQPEYAPTAANVTVSVLEGATALVNLSGTATPSNHTLLFAVTSLPPASCGQLYSVSGANAALQPLTAAPAQLPNAAVLVRAGVDSCTFTYAAVDADNVDLALASSAPAYVVVNVTAVNNPPVAANRTVTVTVNTPQVVSLGFDEDSPDWNVTIVTTVANGTLVDPVTLTAVTDNYPLRSRLVSYLPQTDVVGAPLTNFTYRVFDGQSFSSVGTVTIDVVSNNSLSPTPQGQQIDFEENSRLNITLTIVGGDASTVTWVIATAPQYGTLYDTTPDFTARGGVLAANARLSLNSLGQVIYVPNPQNLIFDSFEFTVVDPDFGTAPPATVLLNVTKVSLMPVVSDSLVPVVEDTPVNFTLSCVDLNSDPLSVAFATLPASGALTVAATGAPVATGVWYPAAAFQYRPAADSTADAQATFACSNGGQTTATATVSFDVQPVNDPPVATNATFTVPEDTTTFVPLLFTDADVGDSFSFEILALPANGTLRSTLDGYQAQSLLAVGVRLVAANSSAPVGVLYTPQLNFNGVDAFRYRVIDAAAASSDGVASLSVQPVNDVPTAVNQRVNVSEDADTPVTLLAYDADLTPLTYTILSVPLSGGVVRVAGVPVTAANLPYTMPGSTLSYQPDADRYSCPAGAVYATVVWTASDGQGGVSPAAFLELVVDAQPDPPATTNVSVDVLQNSAAAAVPLPGTDPDLAACASSGDYLRWQILSVPASGALFAENASSPGQPGASIGAGYVFAATANASQAAFPLVFYRPAANFFGADAFTYRVFDATNLSSVGAVLVQVLHVNQPPVANSTALVVNSAQLTNISLGDLVADIDTCCNFSFVVTLTPSHGALYTPAGVLLARGDAVPFAVGGYVRYLSDSEYFGPDAFSYYAVDVELAASSVANVTLTVLDVNDPPVTLDQFVFTYEETWTRIELNSTDPDRLPQATAYVLTVGPSSGEFGDGAPTAVVAPSYPYALSSNVVYYRGAVNFVGIDSVQFAARDNGTANFDSTRDGLVTVFVQGVNDPPQALQDNYTLDEGASIWLTLRGADAADTAAPQLTYYVAQLPALGVLRDPFGYPLLPPYPIQLSPNATLQYTASLASDADDAFDFFVYDGSAASPSVRNYVTIVGVYSLPVAVPQSLVTLEDTLLPVVLQGVADAGHSVAEFQIVSPPLHGSFTQANLTLGQLTYLPALNYFGADQFSFVAVDDTGNQSQPATVALFVDPAVGSLLPLDQTATLLQGSSVFINLAVSLPSDEPPVPVFDACAELRFQIVSLPSSGYLLDVATGANVSAPGTSLSNCTVEYVAPGDQAGNPLTLFEFIVFDRSGFASLYAGTVSLNVLSLANPFISVPTIVNVRESTVSNATILYQTATSIAFSMYLKQVSPVDCPATLNSAATGALLLPGSEIPPMPASVPPVYMVTVTAPSVTAVTTCFFNIYLNSSSSAETGQSVMTLTIDQVFIPPSVLPASQLYGVENTDVYFNLTDQITDPDETVPGYPLVAISNPPSDGILYYVNASAVLLVANNLLPIDTLFIYRPRLYGSSLNTTTELFPFDSFGWTAVDSTGFRATPGQVVTVYIAHINNPPVCLDAAYSTRIDRDVIIPISVQEIDDPVAAWFVSTSTQFGTLLDATTGSVLRAGSAIRGPKPAVRYLPFLSYIGSDSFAFTATDESGADCATAGFVSIDVYPDTAPTAGNPSGDPLRFTGQEDTPLVLTLFGFDPDGDPLSLFVTSIPLNGLLYQFDASKADNRGALILIAPTKIADPSFRLVYLPNKDQFSPPGQIFDEFTFNARDDLLTSRVDGRVQLFINGVQDVPVSRNISLSNQPQGQPFAITMFGTSPDPGAVLRIELLQLPQHGQLRYLPLSRAVDPDLVPITSTPFLLPGNRPKIWYVPEVTFAGVDQYQYRTVDQTVPSSVEYSPAAWVTINIYPVNSPPVAYDGNFTDVKVGGAVTAFKLNGTDIDPGSSLEYTVVFTDTVINNTEVCTFWQLGENDAAIEPISALPATVINTQQRLGVSYSEGFAACLLSYQISDGLALSNTGNIYFTSGAKPPAKPTPFPIAAVAGAVAGVGVGVLACAVFWWWYVRKRSRDTHSVAGALVQQRKSSKDILERLLVQEGFHIVSALAEVSDPNPASRSELAAALVNLFVANEGDAIFPLIELMIKNEVRKAKNPAALFGPTSVALHMMKSYAKLLGKAYLAAVLKPLLDEVMSRPGAYEVDPKKIAAEQMEENWRALVDVTTRVIAAIAQSGSVCPVEIKRLCNVMSGEVIMQFPDYRVTHVLVGNFMFDRFFCPAISSPEAYDLCVEPPSMQVRRGLHLIAKTLSKIASVSQFGAKEEYLLNMNAVIVAHMRDIRTFLDEVCAMPEELGRLTKIDLESHEKADALDVIHRHLFAVQEEVALKLTHLDSDVTGLEFLEHINVLELLTSLRFSDQTSDEIIDALIRDLPLVSGVCSTIPPGSASKVAQMLITIFEAHGETIRLLSQLIAQDIAEAPSPNMLFRENSTALRMVKAYLEIVGLPYLQQESVLGVAVKLIVNEPHGYEIDREKIPDASMLARNVDHLSNAVDEILNNIYTSVASFPVQIRVLCKTMFLNIQNTHFSERRYSVLIDFIFSRIFCPAIVTPMAFGIVNDRPSLEANRALLLVSKAIQTTALSAGRTVELKGPMAELAPLIQRHTPRMFEYIDRLIDVSEDSSDLAQSFDINQDILYDAVQIVHAHIIATAPEIRQKLTPDARETGNLLTRLKKILLDLGPPIQLQSADRR